MKPIVSRIKKKHSAGQRCPACKFLQYFHKILEISDGMTGCNSGKIPYNRVGSENNWIVCEFASGRCFI